MLCIAAFIVLLFLAAVSAKYRTLLRRAWGCMARRVTFRPCDTTFREDVKNSLLAPVAVRSPRLVGPASVAIEVVAFLMVLSLVLSLYIVGRSGLNLAAYGTCNRADPVACSLSSTQGCGIASDELSFSATLMRGDVVGAFRNEGTALVDAAAAVPNRIRTWDATEFTPAYASYLGGRRDGLPVALEIIDPGCQFCAHLFRNLKEAGVDGTHNIAYVPYPIGGDFAPRFQHSPLVTRYLIALQMLEAEQGAPSGEPTDWAILEQMFTGINEAGRPWQVWFNEEATTEQATDQLHAWLTDAGYDADGIARVVELAESDRVEEALVTGMNVVEKDIRTVTIPSLIIDGDLIGGAVSVEDLQKRR
ncbi:MAG: hypothetical protein Q4G43_02785 [Mobilicoccus sp.]|nr:hypothetical protein [Mobilicoccus sp.]